LVVTLPRTPLQPAGMRHCSTMLLSAVLIASGLFATVVGCWRGYGAARAALVPLLREGEPTRSLIEARRPVHARTRVRLAARQALVAVLWITLSLYGMYLATVGVAVAR
jgi:hypothetical protein